jgi:5-(carboxyamino)imidazole ribonucleotide mutase
MNSHSRPLVGVIMGSSSDWETLEATAETLTQLNIPFETKVVSAHRTPQLLVSYATEASTRGLEVIIAGAGGAAHLPGMVASMTHLPVIGIPVQSKTLQGLDSLLSIVQMPAGVPVATVAIGVAGARNAALLAASILGLKDPSISNALQTYRSQQTQEVLNAPPLARSQK